MANTYVFDGQFLDIAALDSDCLWTTHFPAALGGVRVHSISFFPGAASEKCVIKNKTDTGAIIFQWTASGATDERIQYFYGEPIAWVVDFSAGVYANAASRIVIHIK
jgi:hypothetical protein